MFRTECSWQTKEPLWCCGFQKPRLSIAAIYAHVISSWITFFWPQHNIHGMQQQMQKQNPQVIIPASANTCTKWLHTWQRLLSSGDTEGACCLFVSSSALFPLERYVTAGGRDGGKKEQDLLAVAAPCFHPTSFHPLPLLRPIVQLCVFITCGNGSFCLLPECFWGLPQIIWFSIPACSMDGGTVWKAASQCVCLNSVTQRSRRAVAWSISEWSQWRTWMSLTHIHNVYTKRESSGCCMSYITAYLTGNSWTTPAALNWTTWCVTAILEPIIFLCLTESHWLDSLSGQTNMDTWIVSTNTTQEEK